MARPAILGTALITIFKKHHLLSVGEILALLPVEFGKNYNKTSVYRALEKLEEQDTICKYTFSSGETKYELRQEHHDHLVCSQCGKVQAANCEVEIPSMVSEFKTEHFHLTVFGLCDDCQKKSTD